MHKWSVRHYFLNTLGVVSTFTVLVCVGTNTLTAGVAVTAGGVTLSKPSPNDVLNVVLENDIYVQGSPDVPAPVTVTSLIDLVLAST